ncbi:hypothetical protein MPSEU_000581000 [Mayamaea pseudoterrestris]|nr:hypothetical protein MPSEU_000581000 [Mayamaea pseudoterrestris]
MTPSNSFTNTASSLRWRARLTKDATTTPNDDSNLLTLSTTTSFDSVTSMKPSSKRWTRQRIIQRIIFFICSLCIVSSLYSLLASRTIFVCVTAGLSVFSTLVLVRQRLLLSHAPTVKSQYISMRKQLQSLRLKNERLLQQSSQLEDDAEKMKTLEQQLKLLAARGAKSTAAAATASNQQHNASSLTTTVLQYAKLQQQLINLLATQVQSTMLKALVLAHHVDDDEKATKSLQQQLVPPMYRLRMEQLDRLVKKLHTIPGVTSVHTAYLQDLLHWEPPRTIAANDNDGDDNDNIQAHRRYETALAEHDNGECTKLVPILMHQVEMDATLQTLSCNKSRQKLAFGTTPRGTHAFFTPFRKDYHVTDNDDATTKNTSLGSKPTNRQQPPVVVFGMHIDGMVHSRVKEGLEGKEGDRWNGKETVVDRPRTKPSPKGSLHSC